MPQLGFLIFQLRIGLRTIKSTQSIQRGLSAVRHVMLYCCYYLPWQKQVQILICYFWSHFLISLAHE